MAYISALMSGMSKKKKSKPSNINLCWRVFKVFDIAKEGEELIVIVDIEKEIETVDEKKTWWGSVKEVSGY